VLIYFLGNIGHRKTTAVVAGHARKPYRQWRMHLKIAGMARSYSAWFNPQLRIASYGG
jgi:hypothetical protein